MARLTPDEIALERVRRWREVWTGTEPGGGRHDKDENGKHREDCARCGELERYVMHGGPRPEGVRPRRTA